MPVLPSPAQVGLREPAYPMSAVYVNALKDFCDRGWLATYSRENDEFIGLPRPVKLHGNFSASEIGADRLNDFLPYDIFCAHAAVPTNNLEKCRVKVHLNQQVNGMLVDALSPSTHLCAYTIVVKNASRKHWADLFGNGKLIIPIVNYTDPLVVTRAENPYRKLLGVPRANPGFDYQNEFTVPPPGIPQPMPVPPPYRAPPAYHPSRAAPFTPPRGPTRAMLSAPPHAAPGPSSSSSKDKDMLDNYLDVLLRNKRPLADNGTHLYAFANEDGSKVVPLNDVHKVSSLPKLPQKQKLDKEHDDDDEVEIIWQGRAEPRGGKPTPIDVDLYPSPPRRRRQNSPAPSSPQPSSQEQPQSKVMAVIPLGNRANDLDMLSGKQVLAGQDIDQALINATEGLFNIGHFDAYPKSHPGHPDAEHVSKLDPYRNISAENIIGYFNELPANVALRQLTSVIGLHVDALQGLFRSTSKCSACRRVFEGEAMLKHYVTVRGTRRCAHGDLYELVKTVDNTARASTHIKPALLTVAQAHANTFHNSVEFPEDALTVAWALWASYIGVPEDVYCFLSTGYVICERCRRARTFVAHEAHLHACFQ